MCNVLHQVNWQSVCVLCWDAQERFPCSDARGCILESLKNWGWWCRSDITLSSIPIPCQMFDMTLARTLVSGLNLICLTNVHPTLTRTACVRIKFDMFDKCSHVRIVSVSCFIDITFQIFIFNIIRLIYVRYNRAVIKGVIKGRSRILNRKCLT